MFEDSSRRDSPVTVLDALENHFGDRPSEESLKKLSTADLTELRDVLGDFWEVQADQAGADDASFLGGFYAAYDVEMQLRRELSDALLYYPKLLLLDPLANYFDDRSSLPEMRSIRYRRPDGAFNLIQGGPKLWDSSAMYMPDSDDSGEAALRFAAIVKNLYDLETPIRTGAIELRSQWPILRKRRSELETAVRHDVANSDLQAFIARIPADETGLTVWDNLRGMQVTMDLPVHPQDEKWRNAPSFYYVNKMLAVADCYDATYVPTTEVDLELLRLKVNAGLHSLHPEQMLREVARVVVPSVEVPIRQAAKMREDSENFDDWRRGLRRIGRDGVNDSPEELRQRIGDELLPRVHAVQRELKGSSLGDLIRSDGTDVVLDATATLGAVTMFGEPVSGLAAVGGSGLLKWLRKAYMRKGPGGADAVLATLIRASDRRRRRRS